MSERLGVVDGKKFITAVCVANDLTLRLGAATTLPQAEHGWMRPSIFGTFGAATAAGKILELSENQMLSVFSIAFMQTAGTWESASATESNLRAIRDAFPSQAGVLSALMAQKPHIVGFRGSFEGKFGLFPVFFRGHYNSDRALAGLGSIFEGSNISFKPWPSCRCSQKSVAAVLDILQEYDIKPQDIEKIVLNIDSSSVPLCSPLEERRRPKTPMGAKFSLPYVVAAAVNSNSLTLTDFTPEAIRRPDVLALADKIVWQIDPEIDGMAHATPPVLVELECQDGKSYTKRVDFLYGHPEKPISLDDLKAKFRDCASYSIKQLASSP